MGVTNRAKDASEQKDVYTWFSNQHGATTVNTGATAYIALMPYPGVVQSLRAAAVGLSGVPSLTFAVMRGGSGGTLIAAGISALMLVEIGATGVIGYSGLAATGSTLLNVQAGDLLHIATGVANTACRQLIVEVVVKKIQDIVSYNGVST